MMEPFSGSGSVPQRLALLNKLLITEVIYRERLARDNHDWEQQAACYHPDSSIDIPWFKGSGRDFVAATKEALREGGLSFYIFQSMQIEFDGDRVLAEMPCTQRNFSTMGSVDFSIEGFTRLLWRVQRSGDEWLIAGLRVIYVRDFLIACNPANLPQLDREEIAQLRPSYRHLVYHLKQAGLSPRDDPPGSDRPELVVALRENERKWLTTSGSNRVSTFAS